MLPKYLKSENPEKQYRNLFLLCILMLVLFAVPDVFYWVGWLAYTVLAIVMIRATSTAEKKGSNQTRFRNVGIIAIASIWLWSFTPIEFAYSGIPVVIIWSIFVCWGIFRLVRIIAEHTKVTARGLFAAAAGYVLIGIVSGLVFSAIETISPNSFEPFLQSSPNFSNMDTLSYTSMFAELNYYALNCLTTIGFGDIIPVSPVARMASVITALFGTFYLAVIIGLLVGRYSNSANDLP